MWKIAFMVFSVVVASVTSAPSFLNDEEEPELEPLSTIDQLIVKYRTRFLNDFEHYLNVMEDIERAENKYRNELQSRISRVVSKARDTVLDFFGGVSEYPDVAECKKEASALGPFASIVMSNITNCISNHLPSTGKPSLFDLVDYTADKLSAIKDEMHSCGGTFDVDSFRDGNYQDDDYEENNVQYLEAADARENVNCTEVTAKVSKIVQETIDSLREMRERTDHNVASIEALTHHCEKIIDYVGRSNEIVENVNRCIQSAQFSASAIG